MALVKWKNRNLYDPWAEMRTLQNEINELFRNDCLPGTTGLFDRSVTPAIDFIEGENERKELQEMKKVPAPCDIFHDNESVVLYLEMPGVTKENLQIRVDKDLLIIDGTKETMDIEGKYIIHEIRDIDYHQEYTIDDTIDRNNINASIKNGIVTLSLGVKESEKPKRIQITAG